jgi:hypothetical protein
VKPRSSLAALGAAALIAAAGSCGDVPTLQGSIAYITPILLPSPAVAVNDYLRDSTGARAPLRVRAYDINGTEIPGVPVTYIVTPIDTGIHIDANGYLSASDSVRSATIVARIGDRLQTTAATLPVVPVPTSLSRPANAQLGDTAIVLPAIRALPVVVFGTWRSATSPVPGVVVRYAIDSVTPASAAGSAVLTNAVGTRLRPDSTVAVDTTIASTGTASHTNLVVAAGTGVRTVYVRAIARDFRGNPLAGSPVTFVLPFKP